jgi:adenylate cyclase class 2
MNTEYEIKVLGVPSKQALNAIEKLNLTRHKKIIFRRYIYEIDGQPEAWIRLRSDGTKTTLTYKKFTKDAIDGMKEIEIIVDSLDVANDFLEAVGFNSTKYQENSRLLFTNDEIEISIDEWPKIPPYIEIEGKSQQAVKDYITRLGFDKYEMTSKPTSAIYKMHDMDINSFTRLTF